MHFTRSCLGVALAALLCLSCATNSSTNYVWQESRFGFLPVGLQGAPVMILPIGGVDVQAGWAAAPDTGRVARLTADSTILATLTRRLPVVYWVASDEVRARAEANPDSLPHPDSLPMNTLTLQVMMGIAKPLKAQLLKLNTVSRGRFIFYPVRVTFRPGKEKPVRAEITAMLLEVATGVVGWRSDVAGESDNPQHALSMAVLGLTGTWR